MNNNSDDHNDHNDHNDNSSDSDVIELVADTDGVFKPSDQVKTNKKSRVVRRRSTQYKQVDRHQISLDMQDQISKAIQTGNIRSVNLLNMLNMTPEGREVKQVIDDVSSIFNIGYRIFKKFK